MKRKAWIVFACLHAAAFLLLLAASLTLKFVGSALLLPGFLVWFYVAGFVPPAVAWPAAVAIILVVNGLAWRTIAAATTRAHAHPQQNAPR
jgi:hypothetical protein